MKAVTLFFISLFIVFLPASKINAQNKTDKGYDNSTMKDAYELSNIIVKDRLKNEDSTNVDLINNISASDLIVINGTYDHIHLVLSYLKLPFTSINHNQLDTITFKQHQTVFVNCASSFPEKHARKLATFVAQGGQLITTDWALKFVLEKAFPGYVSYNNKPTADEVVRVEVMDKDDPVITGFLDEETAPVWWLEGSSYPIKILNKSKVKVLIRSKELKEKYGEEAVLIRFEYGEGVVYHMISHFYLQRTETKDAKQTGNAKEYMEAKSVSNNALSPEYEKQAEKVNYGEAQSANTSSEFIMRAVVNQKRKVEKRNK